MQRPSTEQRAKWSLACTAVLLAACGVPGPSGEEVGSTHRKESNRPPINVSGLFYADSVRSLLTQSSSGSTLYVADATAFQVDDEVMVVAVQGPQLGLYETAHVSVVDPVTSSLVLDQTLARTFDTSAGNVVFVQVVPHWGAVTVMDGGNITAHGWSGAVTDGGAGIVFFRADSVTVQGGGKIDVTGLGYRGGAGGKSGVAPLAGEGPGGGSPGRNEFWDAVAGGGASFGQLGAIGHEGSNCSGCWNVDGGLPGPTYGEISFFKLYVGSGGGGGGYNSGTNRLGRPGSPGGGAVFIDTGSLVVHADGKILADGVVATRNSTCANQDNAGGGAGAGGTLLFDADAITIDPAAVVSAVGGYGNTDYNYHCTRINGSTTNFDGGYGGMGGAGRIGLQYGTLSGSSTPAPDAPFSLTISSSDGSVAKSPSRAGYYGGQAVQLTATPNVGWSFVGWSGDIVSTDNPVSFVMTANASVAANYVPIEYDLIINSVNGSVARSPNKATYHEGDVVQLTATANPNWHFTGWSGALVSGANPASVTIHGDTSVTANYELNEYALTINSPNGTVTKSPDQPTYHAGDVVQLTAVPSAHYAFAGWTGALVGSANPASVTIQGPTSVTASYVPREYTLTIDSPNGTVTKSPDQPTYHAGDVVQLTAVPNAHYVFAGWIGVAGTGNPASVTVQGDTSVTAKFALEKLALKVSKAGKGSGTITSSPAGISCGPTCLSASGLFPYNTQVTLTATPGAGSTFAGWSAPCSGVGPCKVTLDVAKTVSATFRREFARNGGFETYPTTGTVKVPTYWLAAGFGVYDGKDTTIKNQGLASVKMLYGPVGTVKKLSQTIALSGSTGTRAVLAFSIRGSNVPTTGLCQAKLTFFNGTLVAGSRIVSCPTGTYAFQRVTTAASSTTSFTKVVVEFTYSKNPGAIWLDDVSLTM